MITDPTETTLADQLQNIIDEKLTQMKAAGIQWSAERQAAYNAACLQFYQASMAKDELAQHAALSIVRRMETEGGLL